MIIARLPSSKWLRLTSGRPRVALVRDASATVGTMNFPCHRATPVGATRGAPVVVDVATAVVRKLFQYVSTWAAVSEWPGIWSERRMNGPARSMLVRINSSSALTSAGDSSTDRHDSRRGGFRGLGPTHHEGAFVWRRDGRGRASAGADGDGPLRSGPGPA